MGGVFFFFFFLTHSLLLPALPLRRPVPFPLSTEGLLPPARSLRALGRLPGPPARPSRPSGPLAPPPSRAARGPGPRCPGALWEEPGHWSAVPVGERGKDWLTAERVGEGEAADWSGGGTVSPPCVMRSRCRRRRRALSPQFECEAQPELLEPPPLPPGGSRQVRLSRAARRCWRWGGPAARRPARSAAGRRSAPRRAQTLGPRRSERRSSPCWGASARLPRLAIGPRSLGLSSLLSSLASAAASLEVAGRGRGAS